MRLAVLPFSNLGDERHEYFGDGLHEELISQLGGLCRGRLGVLARWSSVVFKGTSLRARDVGEALRADYLLEGSVRHEDDRVRITARLVETASETQIWAEMYDRHLTHCLSVQSRRRGADRSRAGRRARPRRARADAVGGRVGRVSGLSQGPLLLEQDRGSGASIRRSPTTRKRWRSTRRSVPPPPPWPAPRLRAPSTTARCRASRSPRPATPRVGRSTSIRSLYEAHLALAETQRMLDFDWSTAEASYLKALALNPSSESAHRAYALLLSALGRHREAVRESDRAIELDPLCLVVGGSAAWVAYAAGDYPAAIEIARNTIDMDPEFVRARRVLAAAYLQSGRHDEAVQELETSAALTDHPILLAWLAHVRADHRPHARRRSRSSRACSRRTGYRQHYALAVAYVGLGRMDDAFDALDIACLDRDPLLAHIAVEPRFEPLRGDPRFRRS